MSSINVARLSGDPNVHKILFTIHRKSLLRLCSNRIFSVLRGLQLAILRMSMIAWFVWKSRMILMQTLCNLFMIHTYIQNVADGSSSLITIRLVLASEMKIYSDVQEFSNLSNLARIKNYLDI